MSVPFPTSPEGPETFDLGVDDLMNAGDIESMDDPWTPSQGILPDHHLPAPMQVPTPGLAPWAGDLQLPGI